MVYFSCNLEHERSLDLKLACTVTINKQICHEPPTSNLFYYIKTIYFIKVFPEILLHVPKWKKCCLSQLKNKMCFTRATCREKESLYAKPRAKTLWKELKPSILHFAFNETSFISKNHVRVECHLLATCYSWVLLLKQKVIYCVLCFWLVCVMIRSCMLMLL